MITSTQCHSQSFLIGFRLSHLSTEIYHNLFVLGFGTYNFRNLGMLCSASNLISPNGLPRNSNVIRFFGSSSLSMVFIRFPDRYLSADESKRCSTERMKKRKQMENKEANECKWAADVWIIHAWQKMVSSWAYNSCRFDDFTSLLGIAVSKLSSRSLITCERQRTKNPVVLFTSANDALNNAKELKRKCIQNKWEQRT